MSSHSISAGVDQAVSVTISTCSLAINWWVFVMRGVLALILAALAFLKPDAALLAVTIIFGAFSIVDGAFGLVSAVRKIGKNERWGWLAFSGALSIIAGIVVVVAPLVATLVIAAFLWGSVALWSILTGLLETYVAIRLRREIQGEIWLTISGVISVALGLVVIWLFVTRPVESFMAAGWLLGAYWLLSGITLTLLGLRLRRLVVNR